MAFHGAQFMWVAVLPIYAYADLGVSTATWGLLFALNGILILALQLRVTSAAGAPVTAAVHGGGGDPLGTRLPRGGGNPRKPALVLPLLAAAIVLVTFGEMAYFPVEPSFVSDLSLPSSGGATRGTWAPRPASARPSRR